jgi:hypothetical protein
MPYFECERGVTFGDFDLIDLDSVVAIGCDSVLLDNGKTYLIAVNMGALFGDFVYEIDGDEWDDEWDEFEEYARATTVGHLKKAYKEHLQMKSLLVTLPTYPEAPVGPIFSSYPEGPSCSPVSGDVKR